jgi:hypothetical protein
MLLNKIKNTYGKIAKSLDWLAKSIEILRVCPINQVYAEQKQFAGKPLAFLGDDDAKAFTNTIYTAAAVPFSSSVEGIESDCVMFERVSGVFNGVLERLPKTEQKGVLAGMFDTRGEEKLALLRNGFIDLIYCIDKHPTV